MWFGQTGLNVNRFETGLSASVNAALRYCYLLYALVAYFTNIGLLLRVPGGGSNHDLILSIITIERMETKLVSICVSEDGGGGITDQKCI